MKNLKSGVYKTTELEKIFGNRMAIGRACEKGEIERVAQGIYATSDLVDEKTVACHILSKYYPDAVVSKSSALYFHDLYDYPGDEFHADLSSDASYIGTKFVLHFHKSSFINGVTRGNFNGLSLPVYSPERAVFEALYLEPGLGNIVNEVVIKYLNKFDSDGKGIAKLMQFSQQFGERGAGLVNIARSIRQSKEIY